MYRGHCAVIFAIAELSCLPRARGVAVASRPSVTLRYCGHCVVWDISKVITPTIGVESLLSAAPNIINLVQGENPQISGGTGMGVMEKSAC